MAELNPLLKFCRENQYVHEWSLETEGKKKENQLNILCHR
jgi:hypothetical protein